MTTEPLAFQDLILTLHKYWGDQGCAILQPYDIEVGAGTLHPATVLRASCATLFLTTSRVTSTHGNPSETP